MEQVVLKFQQTHSEMLPLIVQHLLKLGVTRASQITDEEIQAAKERCQHEEEAAKRKGTILLITPEFQQYIITATRELARMFNNTELTFDVSLLIAQNVVASEAYLKEAKFNELQRAYWESVIHHYVESLADEKERKEYEQALEDDGMDEVIDRLLNDDAPWKEIDDSIDYAIRLLF